MAGDPKTLNYYSAHAEDIFNRYEQVSGGVSDFFAASFPTGARVLDIGAGSGRDLRRLLELGYNAYGVEPTDELRERALATYPILKGRFEKGTLPDSIPYYGGFDGILCSAVLMHLPSNQHFDALVAMRNLLNDHGRLLISIPAERPDIEDNRDTAGRLFETIPPEQLKLLCQRLGLECIDEFNNDDAMGRQGTRWATLLFVKRSKLGQPLDRIESVLRNDKKVATYKLALLRALCDLSERDERAVSWRQNQRIGIPIQHIAECWLQYYWPLVASPQLLPQIQSEAKGGKPIKFRASLSALIRAAQQHYGVIHEPELLSLFMLQWRRGQLPDELMNLTQKTLRSIAAAIKDGPIKYADDGTMFAYDKASKQVLIDAELWREFCLTGYWVRDSLLLRWAELVERFAHKYLPAVSQGIVMELLLQQTKVDREQSFARKLYLQKSDLRCVWTEQSLPARAMDVDHALPFALWHNNDLWNLQPAAKRVNNQKRDGVPQPSLLRARRDALIENWDYVRQQEPTLFAHEVQRTLGAFSPSRWQDDLFNHMKLKAEQAIYSRGAVAWEPRS